MDRYESSLVLGMDYSIGVIHKESFMTLKTDILVLRLPKTQQFSIPRFPGWRVSGSLRLSSSVLGEILLGDDQKIHAEIDGGS